MGTKKKLEPADHAVADVLAEKVKESGLSYRAIREETGMSINRIGIILRKEPPPATIGEIGAIAGEIGLTASEIVGEAERRTRRSQRPELVVVSDEEYAALAALNPGYDPNMEAEGAQELP